MNNIIAAKELIVNSSKIILTAHTNPDGDAIGSLYGLYLALKKMGKNPIVLLEDFNPRFNVIMSPEVVCRDGNIDAPEVFISLDCGGKDRINEEHAKYFDLANKTINIDHHISNDSFADVNIVNTEMSSASEVVFDLIDALVEVDKDIMSSLYAGIVYDSAGFKHKSVSSNTHKIAGIAHSVGIDFNTIYNNILSNHTLTEIKVLSKAIENMKFDKENAIIYTSLTLEEVAKCNSSKDELGSIVSFLINTEGYKLAIFAYEKEDGSVKISLRSKQLDVNALASTFGGGGHKLASGCTFKCGVDEALESVHQRAKELIHEKIFV